MSETIVKLEAQFHEQSKAQAIIGVLRNQKDCLRKVVEKIENSDNYTSEIADTWFVDKVGRQKKKIKIKLIGPPSGGALDGLIYYLTDYGAFQIVGSSDCNMTDSSPNKFRFINGKPVEPEVDVLRFLENFQSSGDDINRQNGAGWTPLHSAAEQGRANLAKALLCC